MTPKEMQSKIGELTLRLAILEAQTLALTEVVGHLLKPIADQPATLGMLHGRLRKHFDAVAAALADADPKMASDMKKIMGDLPEDV